MSSVFVYLRYPTAASGLKTVIDDWIHATNVNKHRSMWIKDQLGAKAPLTLFHARVQLIKVEFGDRVMEKYPSLSVLRFNAVGSSDKYPPDIKTGDTWVVIPRDLMLWASTYLEPRGRGDVYHSATCYNCACQVTGKSETYIRKDLA